MAEPLYDVAVLGGGTGGYAGAIRAAQLGLKVALIEADKLGGTCVHRGCIPTKALLESAEVLDIARHSSEFGVNVSEPSFDFQVIQDRKQKVVDQMHQGIETLIKQNKITLVRGKGRFVSPTQLQVTPADGQPTRVGAKNVIIATGSYPRSLPGLEIDGVQVINSDQVLQLTTPPASLIVLGAGAVGVEFASLFHDLGSEVTLVEFLPAVVPLEDKDVSTELERQFKARGIRVLTGARLLPETLKRTEGGVTVEVEQNGQKQMLTAQTLLVAVGRGPIVEDMGFDKLKLEFQRGGYIQVDDYMRTGEPNVFAIGDVNGGMLLAHVAAAECELAAEVIAGHHARAIDYNRVPRTTYCRPQIGSLGLSEQQAKDQGYKVKTGRFSYAINGRAVIQGATRGFCKVVADADSGELLGVHVIGHNASELVAEAALARYLEATPEDIGTSIHAHPTLTEIVKEAALDADRRAIHFYRR